MHSTQLYNFRIHTTKSLPVYCDEGTSPKKGGGSSFTVTLPSSLEPKGQRPLTSPLPLTLEPPAYDYHLPFYFFPLNKKET